MKKRFIPTLLSFLLFLSLMPSAFADSIGDISNNPEKGWTRYLYDEVNITYEGKWTVCQVSRCTKNEWQTSGAKIKFNFIGEQFRFISYIYNNSSKDIDVYIDGKKTSNFSLYGTNDSTPRIIYQSPKLNFKEHSVEIVNNTKEYLYIVALDLLDEGSLEPYNPAVPDPVTPKPSEGRAILRITMLTGLEKEYDLSMQEVNAFINWYDTKDAGSGPSKYAINKHKNNIGPFNKRTDYVIFNNILTFEVNEYSAVTSATY
ncbi:bacterial surface protein [Paenibacillus macerans]|uniref:bacterial surface protein n=1 Tax=Paenibacillus macerans TaxID=44252 RepID=UPI0022E3275C|nr:bacterial surface protein [Paenibacillus macerans]